ncbi:hypothetical protein [Bradyrhizobium sp.]|uniref:hypothetical protein n=1 Tax=Bradyrhizobium sp. TaxID=376 RepID=UPI003C3D0E64
MAKDSDRRRGGLEPDDSGGLSGLLAEEDEFDRRTLWRLGTWAALSVGAVVLALVTNQSSIGLRREQSASADLIKQAQQIQFAARESQNETRRLASAIDTLNSDRDRLYSRVAVLEQGLDSVTGAIARQAPAPAPQASTSPTGTGQQAGASAAPPVNPSAPSQQASAPSPPPASTASTPPAVTASVDPPPAAAKPIPAAPVVAPVAATASASADKPDKVADKKDKVADKRDKQASQVTTAVQVTAAIPSEPSPAPAAKSAAAQSSLPVEPSGSPMASKSMMGPPDPAAGKLIEPVKPPKTVTSAPMPEIAAVAPKVSEETESEPAPVVPAPTVQRTEFGVDVGGANSVPGLRALWRGLLRSRSNGALTKLRPIIVIKENNNGLGMQLRLVAGPISDAAAAAKICASLTVNDRGCNTTVFEGQRLVVNADEQAKADTKTASETKPATDSKPEPAPKLSYHHRYVPKHLPKEDDPPPSKPEPSTLSLIFGKR